MSCKIGIPRALLYHYYYPFWESFFQDVGMEIVLSPKTNKKILNDGVINAVDDLCLPFKVYYGHVLQLIGRVDFLFIPRLISLGRNNAVCPKFMGLPDMIRATFKDLPPIIEPVIDLRKSSLKKITHHLGKELKIDYRRVEKAYWMAINRYKQFRKIEEKGYTPQESFKILKEGRIVPKKKERGWLKVAVLGHPYLTNDKYLSMDIIDHLNEMGVDVVTLEMFAREKVELAALKQPKKLFWYFNRQVLGTAYELLFAPEKKVQGIIQVTAFGCGPDSIVSELINIKGRKEKISVLNINLDEHSGQAGLITRLEAFIDLLERRLMA